MPPSRAAKAEKDEEKMGKRVSKKPAKVAEPPPKKAPAKKKAKRRKDSEEEDDDDEVEDKKKKKQKTLFDSEKGTKEYKAFVAKKSRRWQRDDRKEGRGLKHEDDDQKRTYDGKKVRMLAWVSDALPTMNPPPPEGEASYEKGSDGDGDEDGDGPRNHVCKKCNKSFVDSSGLRKHVRIHGEKTFACEVDGCGKRFIDRSKLKRHQLVHTGERPFPCPYEGCNRRFGLEYNLKSHLRVHTGERPYTCVFENCGRRFAQESNLRSHQKIHSKIPDSIRVQDPYGGGPRLRVLPVAAAFPLPFDGQVVRLFPELLDGTLNGTLLQLPPNLSKLLPESVGGAGDDDDPAGLTEQDEDPGFAPHHPMMGGGPNGPMGHPSHHHHPHHPAVRAAGGGGEPHLNLSDLTGHPGLLNTMTPISPLHPHHHNPMAVMGVVPGLHSLLGPPSHHHPSLHPHHPHLQPPPLLPLQGHLGLSPPHIPPHLTHTPEQLQHIAPAPYWQ